MAKKNPQRKTNGVSFLSGGSSAFSNSRSQAVGIVQFFTGKSESKTKVKSKTIVITEYKDYTCTLHPNENPRMIHETILVSIGINGPPVGNCMFSLSQYPFLPILQKNKSLKNNINSEFSVSRRII